MAVKHVKTMTRSEWDGLIYPVECRRLPEGAGGGWLATIPMLGEGAFMADGDTPTEAVDALEELRRDLYEVVIKSGQPIPVPSEDVLPSGRWLQRSSPLVHKELQEAAAAQNISFNAYCNQCLTKGHAILSLREAIAPECESIPDANRMTARLRVG